MRNLMFSFTILFYNKKLDKSIYHNRQGCAIIRLDRFMFDIQNNMFYN